MLKITPTKIKKAAMWWLELSRIYTFSRDPIGMQIPQGGSAILWVHGVLGKFLETTRGPRGIYSRIDEKN